jgi:hypothetical protein
MWSQGSRSHKNLNFIYIIINDRKEIWHCNRVSHSANWLRTIKKIFPFIGDGGSTEKSFYRHNPKLDGYGAGFCLQLLI